MTQEQLNKGLALKREIEILENYVQGFVTNTLQKGGEPILKVRVHIVNDGSIERQFYNGLYETIEQLEVLCTKRLCKKISELLEQKQEEFYHL